MFYQSFFKLVPVFLQILLMLSSDISVNPGSVYRIQNENLLHVLPFHGFCFSRDNFCSNLNSFTENVSRNDWHACKKRGINFIQTTRNSFVPKMDEMRYVAKITNAPIIGTSETKLDKIMLPSELDVEVII